MQGVDLNKVPGGRKGQQQFAQAVAMESANRVLTRRALETLKSIATGEYKPPEEVLPEVAAAEEAPVETEPAPAESEADPAPAEASSQPEAGSEAEEKSE